VWRLRVVTHDSSVVVGAALFLPLLSQLAVFCGGWHICRRSPPRAPTHTVSSGELVNEDLWVKGGKIIDGQSWFYAAQKQATRVVDCKVVAFTGCPLSTPCHKPYHFTRA
jgi:hypothetical protein